MARTIKKWSDLWRYVSDEIDKQGKRSELDGLRRMPGMTDWTRSVDGSLVVGLVGCIFTLLTMDGNATVWAQAATVLLLGALPLQVATYLLMGELRPIKYGSCMVLLALHVPPCFSVLTMIFAFYAIRWFYGMAFLVSAAVSLALYLVCSSHNDDGYKKELAEMEEKAVAAKREREAGNTANADKLAAEVALWLRDHK